MTHVRSDTSAGHSGHTDCGKHIVIRPYRDGDGNGMAEMITCTLKISNRGDYTPEYLDEIIRNYSPAFFAGHAKGTHFYTVCDRDRIIGGITAPDESGVIHMEKRRAADGSM